MSGSRYTPISGDGHSLTVQQTELLATVRELGETRFAARAARWDREASFPFENYADLRAAGLLALCVPRAHGGAGADFSTYCLASAELASTTHPGSATRGPISPPTAWHPPN